jgi:hypothetical protein
MARDLNRCLACGSDYDLTIDHIVPISWGGQDVVSNMQTLCRGCNSRKGDRAVTYVYHPSTGSSAEEVEEQRQRLRGHRAVTRALEQIMAPLLEVLDPVNYASIEESA